MTRVLGRCTRRPVQALSGLGGWTSDPNFKLGPGAGVGVGSRSPPPVSGTKTPKFQINYCSVRAPFSTWSPTIHPPTPPPPLGFRRTQTDDLSWIESAPRFSPLRLAWAARPGGVAPLPRPPTVATVIGPPYLRASASDVVFSDPASFHAGSIHERALYWDHVLDTSRPLGARARGWIQHGVDIFEFFRHYKGTFRAAPGHHFDSAIPPPMVLPNHPSCAEFAPFIAGKLAEMVASGAAVILGRVGEVAPPHLCLPIGIEPLKPRMIHDSQFLNLWCHADAFEYDGLHMLPTIMGRGQHAWTLDHVSGYLHVKLTPRSRTFFGFQFEGVYYAWTVLSFGWTGSCLVYNTLSTEVADFLHRLGVPNLVYLDDEIGAELVSVSPALRRRPGRLDGGLPLPPGVLIDLSRGRAPLGAWPGGSGLVASRAAAFVACSVWSALGYFLQVHIKSVLEPVRSVQWLGVIVDSGSATTPPSFRITPAKRDKLLAQVGVSLAASSVPYKDLERLCGRCASLFLVIPGCLFLTRCMYAALATSRWRWHAPIPLTQGSPLHREIGLWRSVPDGPARPWPEPTHAVLEIWDVVYRTSAQATSPDFVLFEAEPHALALHYRLTHPGLPSDSTGGWLEVSFDWDDSPLRALYRSGIPCYSLPFVHWVLRLALGGLPPVIANCYLDLQLSSVFRPGSILGSDLCHDPDFAYWLFAFAAERNVLISAQAAPGHPYAFDVVGAARLCPRGMPNPSPALPPAAGLDRMLFRRAFRAVAAAFEGAGFPRFRADLMGTPSRLHLFADGVALPSLTRAGLYRFGRPQPALRPGGSLGSQCFSRVCAGTPLFVDPHTSLLGPLLSLLRLQRAGPIVVILPCDSRAHWYPLVASQGLAAMVVCPARAPLPYELCGYAPPAAAPPDPRAGGGAPEGPTAGPAFAAQDSAEIHSDSALPDSGDSSSAALRPGLTRPRRGQGAASWLPCTGPLPTPIRLPHDLLAVLFDFRSPPASPWSPSTPCGRGPLAVIPAPPPSRRTRDFTYVYPVVRPFFV